MKNIPLHVLLLLASALSITAQVRDRSNSENVPQASAEVRSILKGFKPFPLSHFYDDYEIYEDADARRKAASDALEVAEKTGNAFDKALALRAVALTENVDESNLHAGWRRTISAWETAGFAPGRIESLCLAAANNGPLAFIAEEYAPRKLYLARALARTEQSYPLTTARALSNCALNLHRVALDALGEYAKLQNMGGGIDFGVERILGYYFPVSAARLQRLSLMLLEEAHLLLSERAPRSPEMLAILYNMALLQSATDDWSAASQSLAAADRLASEMNAAPEVRAAIAYRSNLVAEKKQRPAQARQYQALAERLLPAPGGVQFNAQTQLTYAGLYVAGDEDRQQERMTQVINVWLLDLEDMGAAGSLPPRRPYKFLTGERGKDRLIMQVRFPFYAADVMRGVCPPFLNAEECYESKRSAGYAPDETVHSLSLTAHKRHLRRITDPDDLPEDLDNDAYAYARLRMLGDLLALMDSYIATQSPTKRAGEPRLLRKLMKLKTLLPNVRLDLAEEHYYERQISDMSRATIYSGSDPGSDAMRYLLRNLASRLVSRLIAAGEYRKALRFVERLRLQEEMNVRRERELIFKARETATPMTPPDDGDENDEHGPIVPPDEIYPYLETLRGAQVTLHTSIDDVTAALAGRQSGPVLVDIIERLAKSDSALDTFENEAGGHLMARTMGQRSIESMFEAEDEEDLENVPDAFMVEPPDPAKILAPGEVYVTFSLGPDSVYAFILRHGEKVLGYKIPTTSQRLLTLIKAFRQGVGDPRTSEAQLTTNGRRLFALLFPGRAGATIQSAKRVIISPEGQMWSLPFAALVSNASGEPNYLGAEKPLFFTHSFTSIAAGAQPSGTPSSAGEVLMVGLSHFDKPVNETLSYFNGRSAQPDLNLAAIEAELIANLYGAHALPEGQASELGVRKKIEQAELIHIATHGFVFSEPALAMSSGVVLGSPVGVSTQDDDGTLQAWEILTELKLKARLVVLSACETGIAADVSEDSFGRLIKSFQGAGAKAVVASQWLVADESTSEFMLEFHRGLRRGLRKDEAIQKAISGLRTNPQTRHPYYWAPFILAGSPDRM
jgi:CHAT domain-containing protein